MSPDPVVIRRRRLVPILVAGAVAMTASAQREEMVEVEPGVYEGMSITAVTDVVFAEARTDAGAALELCMDVAFPADAAEPLPAVIFVHGGAWRQGERSEGHELLGVLARGGYLAATIDYRLVPDSVYPAAVDDVRSAVRFVREHAEALGVDPARIGLIGTTAGGHLATLVALAENDRAAEEEDRGQVAALCCAAAISGSTDLLDERFSPAAREIIGAWVGDLATEPGRTRAAAASPLGHADGGDPPLLLVHGRDDPVVPFDQSRRLARALRESKGVVRHVPLTGGHELDPERYGSHLLRFLDEHLGGRALPAWRRRNRPAADDEVPAPGAPRPEGG